MFPNGWKIDNPAPTAATFGSSSINTFLAPANSATLAIASRSTVVMFVGQQIKILVEII